MRAERRLAPRAVLAVPPRFRLSIRPALHVDGDPLDGDLLDGDLLDGDLLDGDLLDADLLDGDLLDGDGDPSAA